MASNYFFGSDEELLLGGIPKYFYGLRRTVDGDLYLTKLNQLSVQDSITINNPGAPEEDYVEFDYGIDYLDNVDTDHEIQFENLFFAQYRWDNRSMLYYIDENGSLVIRIGQNYVYPSGI
jgi:hypothetical protein